MTTNTRKCAVCHSDISEQAKFCSKCGVRIVKNRINDIIESYVESKIEEKFTTENNIVRSLSDKIEDVIYRRLKIIVIPISLSITIIFSALGFFGYKKYEPIYAYLKAANTAALNAKKTAEAAQGAADQQMREITSIHNNIVSLEHQAEIIRTERSDENLKASLPSLGMKKGVYLNGTPFKNPEGKKVILIYILPDAQLNYSFDEIRDLKKNLEEQGMLVEFGSFTQSKFGSVSFLNNLIYNFGGSSTLYFKKEDLDLAESIQNKFSHGAKFNHAPILIDGKQKQQNGDFYKYIVKNANIAVSVQVY